MTIEPSSWDTAFRDDVKTALTKYNDGVEPDFLNPVPPKHRAILPPPGILRKDFVRVIEAAVLHHQLTAGMGEMSSRALKDYAPSLSLKLIEKTMATPQFRNMLILRGVINETDGLSGEQLRALTLMADVSSNLSLDAKLKKALIPPYKWQAWLNDPKFRAHHDRLANELFRKMQADVDTQVVQGAVAGKLEYIKYYNELSGKHDPNRRAHQDVQTILDGIVEIITRNIKDPEVLTRISSELSAVVSKLG